ncbi:MAG: hypothetical protein ACRD47_10890, partial [Nitrososphaeraceae archaeon]
ALGFGPLGIGFLGGFLSSFSTPLTSPPDLHFVYLYYRLQQNIRSLDHFFISTIVFYLYTCVVILCAHKC